MDTEGIIISKLKGRMDKGGHYDVEMKGLMQKDGYYSVQVLHLNMGISNFCNFCRFYRRRMFFSSMYLVS